MNKNECILDSLCEDIPKEDYNQNWHEYKAHSRGLLKQGIIGFVIGAIIGLGFAINMVVSTTGNFGLVEVALAALSAVVIGCAIACFPYGWGLINRFLGQWAIFGHIIVVIALFLLKVLAALYIGVVVYPIVLVYNLIRSQKSKRKVRKWTIIVISVVVLWYVFLGICAIITASTDSGTNNAGSTEPLVVQTVDVSTFDNQGDLLDAVCQKALESTRETENEYINSYGWTITSPTRVHGVFYLEAKNPENPYRNILKKLDVSNAIVVVTGYFLENAGITINQWEMDVWVYPNYAFDENGVLSYDTENVYNDSLRSDDMEDFMDWFSSEYSKMNITEINVPSN